MKQTPEQIEAERKARDYRVANAWQELALNPAWKTVWEEDLQRTFPPLAPRFRADEQWNPVPAAKRDGNGEDTAHIARRMGIALASIDEEKTRQTEAVAEFQGALP